MNTLKTIDEAIEALHTSTAKLLNYDTEQCEKNMNTLTNLKALRDKLGSEEFVKSEFIRININDIPKNLQHTMEYQLMISPELKEAVDSETPHGKMLICARLVFDAIREHAAIKAMGV